MMLKVHPPTPEDSICSWQCWQLSSGEATASEHILPAVLSRRCVCLCVKELLPCKFILSHFLIQWYTTVQSHRRFQCVYPLCLYQFKNLDIGKNVFTQNVFLWLFHLRYCSFWATITKVSVLPYLGCVHPYLGCVCPYLGYVRVNVSFLFLLTQIHKNVKQKSANVGPVQECFRSIETIAST